MSDLVNALNCQGVTKVPDLSVLTWTVNGCAKKPHAQEKVAGQTYTKYNTGNIAGSFLNDDSNLELVVAAINRIENCG